MKGFFKVIFNTGRLGAIRHLIARKNMQIRAEKEKFQEEKAVNSILTAYVFYIASRVGILRIPKAEISATLGKCSVIAYSDGDDYVIELKEHGVSGEGDADGKAGKLQEMV